MNYEEKYKEALERAKKLHDSYNLMHISVDEIEQIFPELAESEDERIINQLITLVNSAGEVLLIPTNKEELITWLEKQKEQKPDDDVLHKTYQEGFNDGLNYRLEGTGVRYVKEEQKPVDYEAELKKCKDNPLYFYDKYVSIKQKPAEWSEEDEDNLHRVIRVLENNDSDWKELSGWLKSLRPSWKPSEEHLSALLAVFNDPNNIGSQTCQLALTDLYEQLKKL